MLPTVDPTHHAAYYEAALRALRFIEQRAPTTRRFGADADARWAALRGHLETADRIDLLLRDADAQWPSAFGARTVFALRAVAEDDPFGSTWLPLEPEAAAELWRKVLAEAAPASVHDALTACAAAWGLGLRRLDVGSIRPEDKLLVAGPSAIAALATAFVADKDLSFADQVAVVATPHAHRQLAALTGALLNTKSPTRILAAPPEGTNQPPRASDLTSRRVILSEDAAPEDAAFARHLTAG